MVIKSDSPSINETKHTKTNEVKTQVEKEVPSSKIRKDLHKEIVRRSKSLTKKEYNFLSNILNEGNDYHIHKVKHKLSDAELFFNVVDPSEKVALEPLPPLLTIDLPKPLSKLELRERALSSSSIKSTNATLLNDKIWKAHEEGISFNTDKKVSSITIATNIRKKKFIHSRSVSMGYSSNKTNANSQGLIKLSVIPSSSTKNPRAHLKRSKSVSFCPNTVTTPATKDNGSKVSGGKDSAKIPFRDSIKSDNGKPSEKQEERPFITKATPLRRESSIFESESLVDELNFSNFSMFDESRCDEDPKPAWTPSNVGNRPVLMRESSKGNGVEVSVGALDQIRQYDSLFASFASSRTSNSRTSHQRTLSFDELTSTTSSFLNKDDDDASEKSLLGNMSCVSWDEIDSGNNQPHDAWAILKDEYAISNIGYNDTTLPFKILGTNANDVSTKPKVLSPPLMDSLTNFLSDGMDTNFWLKYSLVRDGASLYTMLQHVRGTSDTILAIETMDGDVFGCFVHTPWKLNHNNNNHFYGDGQAFLWRMRRNRYSNTNTTVASSILDQAILESELDVYPWAGKNYMIQFCQPNRIGLGGGATTTTNNTSVLDDSGLFGLALEDDLLSGTTGPCATFNNPCLASSSPNGVFEVANLEVWTLSPCETEAEAEKLEFHKLFFSDASNDKSPVKK